MRKEAKQKNLLIAGLVAVVLVMSVEKEAYV
jgi:hypothetical protein